MHRPGMLRLLVSLLTVLSPIGPAVGSSRGPIDPLEQAAHEGDMGRVKALLAQEPGPYLLERALRFSIRAGHAEITDLLISRGVRYPLMIAAEEGDAKLVERLLAEVQEEKERDSALHATARIGHKEIVAVERGRRQCPQVGGFHTPVRRRRGRLRPGNPTEIHEFPALSLDG